MRPELFRQKFSRFDERLTPDSVIPFGKYNRLARTMREVPAEYLDWFLANAEDSPYYQSIKNYVAQHCERELDLDGKPNPMGRLFHKITAETPSSVRSPDRDAR